MNTHKHHPRRIECLLLGIVVGLQLSVPVLAGPHVSLGLHLNHHGQLGYSLGIHSGYHRGLHLGYVHHRHLRRAATHYIGSFQPPASPSTPHHRRLHPRTISVVPIDPQTRPRTAHPKPYHRPNY